MRSPTAPNEERDNQQAFEFERYELREAQAYRFELSRRELFQALGAGLLIFALGESAEAQESGGRRGRQGGGTPQTIDAWLHIAESGAVTAFTGKVEVGQNSRTALTQAVAEELRVPVASVTLVMGDTALTPYDMGTFGSQTTPRMNPILRRVGAAAREQLLDLAAKAWNVEPSTLTALNGEIKQAGGHRSAGYGELLKGQSLSQNIGRDVALTPADSWRVMGASVPRVNGIDFVTGKHRFASDIRREGMLFGKVLRSPYIDAALSSVDISSAQSIHGVIAVNDRGFVGVAAPTLIEAERALAAIRAEWKPASTSSDREMVSTLRPNAPAAPAPGSLQATYTVAYIAHAPLEPRAAVAEWEGDKLTVWTGTQRPFGVRSELASAFGIPEAQVHVLMPDTGAGYGGKHTGEAAVEAARLAKAAGKPVKLIWTRQEEFSWAYFRPGGVIDVNATTSAEGKIISWQMDNYNSGGSGLESPYNIPGQQCRFHQARSPLRQGSYRGLAGTANHFARESHMEDLARNARIDSLQFRLQNCSDERLSAVLKTAAARFGWEKRVKRAGRGYGMAGGTEKGSYIANCAEVEVDSAGIVKVIRVTAAFECGAIINPTHLQNQVEGATIMGIGGALFEAIKYEDGKLTNPHFAAYRVPRFSDSPAIEVALIDRKDITSAGAGETPIMAIAPAIRNAILDAVGVRLYSLPMAPSGVSTSAARARNS